MSLNIDLLAAKHARQMVSRVQEKGAQMVEILERLTTKTLGVLQEQGVYAMMLFLCSRTSDEGKIAPIIRGELYNILKELPELSNSTSIPEENTEPIEVLKFYSSDSMKKIDTLLLIRDLYEQTLIYARYGAKAVAKEREST